MRRSSIVTTPGSASEAAEIVGGRAEIRDIAGERPARRSRRDEGARRRPGRAIVTSARPSRAPTASASGESCPRATSPTRPTSVGAATAFAGAASRATMTLLTRGDQQRILRRPGGGCYQSAVRAVVQRVSRAEVRVGAEVTGRIGRGLVVLLGGRRRRHRRPTSTTLVDKVVGLRIFADDEGNMNRSVVDVGGALLVVSQFTLYGDARKGRRPSFVKAMAPGPAEQLYEKFVAAARATGVPVETGRFRAMMEVELVNDGPVTLAARLEAAVLTRAATSLASSRRAAVVVLALTLGVARWRGASEPEMFGMGARSPGMAGTGVADAEGYDATLHQPGGPGRTRPSRRLTLGYVHAGYRLEPRRRARPVDTTDGLRARRRHADSRSAARSSDRRRARARLLLSVRRDQPRTRAVSRRAAAGVAR